MIKYIHEKKLFKEKEKFRKEQANLSFEEKLKLLHFCKLSLTIGGIRKTFSFGNYDEKRSKNIRDIL